MMRRRFHTQAGFTLIELMVALVAGLIAITATYYIGAASTRHFSEQQRIGQTQTAVRMAMMQLEADIARAGLLGTPNSDEADTCGVAPPTRIQAIDFEPGQDTAALPNAAQNPWVAADRLILTGNFATSDGYLVNTLGPTGTQVVLQPNWQAVRRDFAPWQQGTGFTTPGGVQRFNEVFRAGRMLKLQTTTGKELFVTIDSTDHTGAGMQGPVINIRTAIAPGGLCVGGLADGATVSPLVQVEYAVVDPRTDPSLLVLNGSPAAVDTALGRTNAVLVRRELDFSGGVVAGTTRIVLEYVADFQFDFVFDMQAGAGLPPNLVTQTDALAAGTLNLNPERVRTVIVEIAARTRQHEDRFAFVPRANDTEPLTSYKVNPNSPGAARVRSLQSEILIPNVAFR